MMSPHSYFGRLAKPGQIKIFGLPFQSTDVVTFGGLLLLTVLAILYNGRLERPGVIIARNILAMILYLGSLALLTRLRRKALRFILRTGVVQFSFFLVFMNGCDLQLIFSSWQDDRVLAWENAIFSAQPLIWIQKFYSPLLNEWMFFVYAAYVIIYPILGAVIYFRHGEDANEDYLFHLGLANSVCAMGFIIFPVASPMYWEKMRVFLTKPFQLGPFGLVAEFIRTHVHTPGGSIPSPHCAIASVMWFMSLKYTRWGFFLLIPICLTLYISTVYGRFHYVTDMIVGIIVGGLTVLAGPTIQKNWNRWAGRDKRGIS